MNDKMRTAVVTGASRGIGAALAERLAADGFRLIVNYASSATQAQAVVDRIAAAGGAATAVRADVADPAGVRALFDAAEAAYGPVDVLVNNAGVLSTAPLAEATDEDCQRLLAIDLSGKLYGLREGARRVRDGGRIISLSTSLVGVYPPGHGVYVAAAAAVEALTRVLAKELGPRGVAVNAVAPGPVPTELFLAGRAQAAVDRIAAEIPMGRLGRPEDVAGVVSFLAGPDSDWVSGQVIRVNGGRN